MSNCWCANFNADDDLQTRLTYAFEPPQVCRRPQLLSAWGYGHEEDDDQIFG
jgi:hypothetical protein